jgi:hypothetical protein
MFKGNKNLLNKNEKIYQKICKDAIDGKNVWKAVSFSLLETLLEYNNDLLEYLEKKYLQQFFDVLNTYGENIHLFLNPNENYSINNFFIFENIISLFIQISQSEYGSNIFENAKFITKITSYKFIDQRPSTLNDDDEIINRYHSLITLILRLILSIFTFQKKKVAKEVIYFISTHQKVVSYILSDFIDNEEVKLVTSIFYHLSHYNDIMKNFQKNLKFEKLMLNLLSKLYNPNNENNEFIVDITKNTVAYLRIISQHPYFHAIPLKVLFTASLDDTKKFVTYQNNTHQPSLGILKINK